MDAKLRAQFKAWDGDERYNTTMEMVKATETGDLKKVRELLSRAPLLDYWVPYEAENWSNLAAAAGQLELMKFWRAREKQTRPARKQSSLESLLFWAMGYEYVKPKKGDPVRVAQYLLDEGANIEGDVPRYSPLHRAVFMNRPKLVELLIQRGADLAKHYATGESALQIARRINIDKTCARLLEAAAAPLELPKRKERPKPVRTVDLRQAARKLEAGIETAVRRFARRHAREVVTGIALASVPHEGYVMVSFDTGEFKQDGGFKGPWDCSHAEFLWIKYPEWIKAHEGEKMRLIDVDGTTKERNPDAFESRFQKMIVGVLESHQKKGTFTALTTAQRCWIGIEMTLGGTGKFWRLRME